MTAKEKTKEFKKLYSQYVITFKEFWKAWQALKEFLPSLVGYKVKKGNKSIIIDKIIPPKWIYCRGMEIHKKNNVKWWHFEKNIYNNIEYLFRAINNNEVILEDNDEKNK